MSNSFPNEAPDRDSIRVPIPANSTIIDATKPNSQGETEGEGQGQGQDQQPLEYLNTTNLNSTISRDRKIWAGLFFSTLFCLVISIVVVATASIFSAPGTNNFTWYFGYFEVCISGDICGGYSSNYFSWSVTPINNTAKAFSVLAVIFTFGLFVLIFFLLRVIKQKLYQLGISFLCIWIIICHSVALNNMMSSPFYLGSGSLAYGAVLQILACIALGIKTLAFFYFMIRGISFKGVCGC